MDAQTHQFVAMGTEIIQGIESAKSTVISAKIKTEIDTLGTQKTTKQIRKKLRNLKDFNKKTKENNRKSGSATEFSQFCYDFALHKK